MNLLKNPTLCVLLFLSTVGFAETDTLRMYNPSDRLLNAQGSFNLQIARFDLYQPTTIQSIVLTLDGDPDTLTLRLFGHEGGTAFPQLLEDIVPAISMLPLVAL